jgi:hypothetical protein
VLPHGALVAALRTQPSTPDIQLTGIDSPYEQLERPDYVVAHDRARLPAVVKALVDFCLDAGE